MKIFIASEFKCTIYKDEYYLAPKAFEIYHRYANAFGDVVLCSRFSATKTLNEGYKKADFIIDRIEIADLMAVLMGKYNDEMSKKNKGMPTGNCKSAIHHCIYCCKNSSQ